MTVVNETAHATVILDDDHLLDAALHAFARSGYAGTSVRELTRDLAVSHNFIHQRFGSKERLWYAAVDHGFARLAADLAATDVGPGDDALVALRAMAIRYVESLSRRPALLRLINAEATTPGPRLDHLYERYIRPVCEFLESLLDRLVAEGRIRPMTVSTLYFMLTNGAAGAAALPGIGARLGSGLDTDVDDDVQRHAVGVVDLLFDGMVV